MHNIVSKTVIRIAGAGLITLGLVGGGSWAASAHPQARADQWQEFDRASAVEFADAHYNDPAHWAFVDDCTYFASETLEAGMLPETDQWTPFTTDWNAAASRPRLAFGAVPTKTYMDADYLKNYLVDNGLATITQVDPTQHLVPGAEPGDLIGYSWQNDGFINHIAVVVGDSDETQVDQHEPNALHKGWNWSSSNNDWITQSTPNVAAYLIHITY